MDAIILTILVALAILVGLLICGAPIFVGFLAVNIHLHHHPERTITVEKNTGSA